MQARTREQNGPRCLVSEFLLLCLMHFLLQVRVLYTAPTLIRSLMQHGDHFVTQHDRSSLRILGSVGEPINPHAWEWFHQVGTYLLTFSSGGDLLAHMAWAQRQAPLSGASAAHEANIVGIHRKRGWEGRGGFGVGLPVGVSVWGRDGNGV